MKRYITWIVWGIMCLAIIILAVVIKHFHADKAITTVEAVQLFLTGSLVLITANYAYTTAKMSQASQLSIDEMKIQNAATTKLAIETQEQRLDSCRPVLIPIEGSSGVANISPFLYVQPEQLLQLRNIGLGPAISISTRLERRLENGIQVKNINESTTATRPIAIGENELVRHWFADDKASRIQDNDWLIVNYYDMFNRGFKTEARYVEKTGIWTDVKLGLVK